MKNKSKKKLLARALKMVPVPGAGEVSVSYETAMEAVENAINSGKHLIAEFQLLQISRQLPSELQPKIRLLACYVQIGRAQPAEQLIAEILKAFPRSTKALGVIGWYYRTLGQGEESLSFLKRAVALDPRNFALHYNLGLSYAALGNKDKAISAFNKSITLNPKFGSGYFERAILLKGDTSPEDLAAMESQLESASMDDEETGLLHLAIAWAYDGKDSERQFAHLKAGKESINATMPWSEQMMDDLFVSITRFFDGQYVDLLKQQAGQTGESPIFIAAMPRSGTTLLEQILGSHSEVYPVGETELIAQVIDQVKLRSGLLNQPFWSWGRKGFISNINEMRSEFHQNAKIKNAGGKRIVEKSLDNIRQVGAILSLFPDAKIIHLRRQPLDVLLSMYQLFVRTGFNTPWCLADLAKHYKNCEMYMEHWKSLFPENICTFEYEDLVSDQENFSRRLLDFCDLPWEGACLQFYQQERTINTPSVMQVNQPINKNSVERWRPYSKYLQEAADILGINLNEFSESSKALP